MADISAELMLSIGDRAMVVILVSILYAPAVRTEVFDPSV